MTRILGSIRYNEDDSRYNQITLVRLDDGKLQLEIGEYKEPNADGVENVYDVNNITIG
jgi:hypothetical protein